MPPRTISLSPSGVATGGPSIALMVSDTISGSFSGLASEIPRTCSRADMPSLGSWYGRWMFLAPRSFRVKLRRASCDGMITSSSTATYWTSRVVLSDSVTTAFRPGVPNVSAAAGAAGDSSISKSRIRRAVSLLTPCTAACMDRIRAPTVRESSRSKGMLSAKTHSSVTGLAVPSRASRPETCSTCVPLHGKLILTWTRSGMVPVVSW